MRPFVLGVALAWAGALHGQNTPALDFSTTTNATQVGVGFVTGYQFSVKTAVTLTQLGAVLSGAPSTPIFGALPVSMQVGVWDSSARLLVSGIVSNTDPRAGNFNYLTVAPTALTPGQSYTVAGRVAAGQSVMSNVPGLTPGAQVNYLGPRSLISGSLAFPSGDVINVPGSGYFGASFAYTASQTGSGPLAPPSIVFPAASSTATHSVVGFQWTSVSDAQYYDFQVTDTSTNRLVLKLAPAASQTSAPYTFRSGTYRLEMKSCNSTACGSAAVSNFTVQLGPVPTTGPSGVSCSVAAENGQNRMNCSWNALAGADFYFVDVVQQGTGPGGGALTVAGAQTSNPNTSLLIPNGSAAVVIRGCTGNGCGPQSAAAPVNAPNGNPLAPVLGQPQAGSTVDGGSGAPVVLFSWSRMPGDTGNNFRYRLYVQDFSRNAPALDVLTSNNFHAAYFNPATRYDAIVIAVPVGGGATQQGPPSGFVTRGSPPKSPMATEPTYQSTVSRNAQGQVKVAWTPIVNTDGSVSTRRYQYYFNGPTQIGGVTTDTSVLLNLAPGSWQGVMRACTTGTSCVENSPTGWGPWNNEPGSEGGLAAFTVQ